MGITKVLTWLGFCIDVDHISPRTGMTGIDTQAISPVVHNQNPECDF